MYCITYIEAHLYNFTLCSTINRYFVVLLYRLVTTHMTSHVSSLQSHGFIDCMFLCVTYMYIIVMLSYRASNSKHTHKAAYLLT